MVGLNFNEFFIKDLKDYHWELMSGAKDLSHHFNLSSKFFLKRRDNSFKEIDFQVKMMPSIDRDLSLPVSISFLSKSKGFLMLLDEDLNVIEAKRKILEVLEIPRNSRPSELHISEISARVALMIELLKQLQAVNEVLDSDYLKTDASADAVKTLIRRILNLNKFENIYYRTDRNSRFISQLKGKRIFARIEPFTFKGLPMTKVYITLQTSSREGANGSFSTF